MKKIASSLALLVLLYGCSSAEPTPETPALPLPDAATAAAPEANLSSDPFLAADQSAASSSPSAAATESKAADSLLATPVPSDPASSASAAPKEEALASPTPAYTPPVEAKSEPVPAPKLSVGHEVAPTQPMPTAKTDPRKHNSYEEYKEFQKKEASRKELQDAYDDRSLFPHEDGGWQIGVDYARNAFPALDFDPSAGTKHADTYGGVLSLSYFPLRSLSYGRLGISVNYSVFWTKYEFNTSATVVDKSTVHSIDSFGSKLVYEADYLLGQLFVPWVFIGMDKVTVRPYSLNTGTAVIANYPKSTFNRHTYGAGMHLNLNRLEPTSASRGLASMGIRKTYITYTYLTEGNGGTGSSHFLGLRFEY